MIWCPQRAWIVGCAIALLGAAAWMIFPFDTTSGRVAVTSPCAFALLIDGNLRCDGAAPRTVAELCGSIVGPPIRLRGGDRLDTRLLCDTARPAPGQAGWGRMAPDDLATFGQPVDVNAADAAELASLPGVGPTLAGRIIEGRPYDAAEDLLSVRGIGPVRLRKMRVRVRVGPRPDPGR